MNRISGKGGNVFAVGDELAFSNVPLSCCEDGWRWVAPEGLRCWTGTVLFEVSDDGAVWDWIEPEEVYPHLGFAMFPRAVTGWVRATGSCFPTAFIGWGQSWRILIDTEVASAPTMTTDGAAVRVKSTVATVDGVISSPLDRALCVLPFQKGAYVGFGALAQTEAGVRVTFDDEGVTYEPCN